VENRWVYGGDAIKSSVGAGALPEYGFAARQYYRIDSANFRILTNIDEQAGREMAERLENLHCAWRQLFFEYWGSGPLLARRFQEGAPDARTRVDKHRIVWFQNREQYIAALRDDQPLIDKTLGIYLDGHRTVFLFGTPEQALTTWLHEVTHQLFNEHGRSNAEVGSRGHIWVVEGIALFMESLWWHGDYCTVGGVDADRLQFARYRALSDRFHVPLAELVMIDRSTIQNDARIGALYSQSAGLSHFFMTGEGGHLRPAFVQYLGAVYRNTASERQLATLVKAGYEELDQRYHAYLTVDDSRLAGCYPVTNLYLGHCAISDDGLRHVPLENVRWIDLGYTSITDGGIEQLRGATQLEKLTLEHTGVTAAALAALGNLTRLEYLDLSGLAITDQSLAELRALENLKSLWLTGCPITDEGLKHLTALRGLETLDVSNTQVTAAGLARLKSALLNLAD
jgi:hypothetical protein